MFNLKEILDATGGVLLSKKRSAGFTGVSIDSRSVKRGDLFIAIKGIRFDGADFIGKAIEAGASGVVVSQHGKCDCGEVTRIRVGDTLRALGDIAAYHRNRFNIPFIGITGSNGKTSVKELTAHLLGSKYNILKNIGTENNLVGVPLTLLRLEKEHSIAVLELGANHPGEIGRLSEILRPDAGVITNIGESHLEFFKDKSGVFKAKTEMINSLDKDSILVINGDDEMLSEIKSRARIIKFGLERSNDFRATDITSGESISFMMNGSHRFTVGAIGKHNVYNVLASLAVVSGFGINPGDAGEALSGFRFPRMRMEFRRVNGIGVINDAYNSNPLSLRNAIEAFSDLETKGRRIVVSGDMFELGEKSRFYHNDAGRLIAGSPVDFLVTVGRLSRFTREGASSAGMDAEKIRSCSDAAEAAMVLKKIIRSGDTVLIKGSRAMHMEAIIDIL